MERDVVVPPETIWMVEDLNGVTTIKQEPGTVVFLEPKTEQLVDSSAPGSSNGIACQGQLKVEVELPASETVNMEAYILGLQGNSVLNSSCGNEELKARSTQMPEYPQVTDTSSKRNHYKCEHCDKTFITGSHLSKHLKSRTCLKSFRCRYCRKYFSEGVDLVTHLRWHRADGLHMCKLCSKTFVTLGRLSQHLRAHTGEEPYKCKYCGKIFSHVQEFSDHEKSHHTGEAK